MSKASRKVDRYNEKQKDVITEEEIQEQFGKLTFTGKILKGIAFMEWMDLTPVNVLIMFLIYLASALLIEPQLMKITTLFSAMYISHGIITSLAIVLFFSYVRKKNPDTKPTLEEIFFRTLTIGLVLSGMLYLTAKYL